MAEKQIKTIGVLTSGGDAPGMNAAIRAVVRRGLSSVHSRSITATCKYTDGFYLFLCHDSFLHLQISNYNLYSKNYIIIGNLCYIYYTYSLYSVKHFQKFFNTLSTTLTLDSPYFFLSSPVRESLIRA